MMVTVVVIIMAPPDFQFMKITSLQLPKKKKKNLLHVAEEGAIFPTIQQFHEGLNAPSTHDTGIGHRLGVDQPLVHRQIASSTSEGILSLVVHGDTRDLPRVGD